MNPEFRAWDKERRAMRFVEQLTFYHNDRPITVLCESGYFGDSDDFILMQFTGLLDKESKEIWEGDILEFDGYEWGGDNNRAIVKWEHGGFESIGLKYEWKHWCEVIGNIYENPELLKGEGNV